MSRNNNFNFYGAPAPDPLLDPDYMDSQIDKMIELRDKARQLRERQPVQQEQSQQQKTAWDEISEELNSMSDAQKEMLYADPEYQHNDRLIMSIASQYQIRLLIPYVLGDENGRKAIETQLHTIRAKKDIIVQRERKEHEEFLRWKAEQAKGATAVKARKGKEDEQ